MSNSISQITMAKEVKDVEGLARDCIEQTLSGGAFNDRDGDLVRQLCNEGPLNGGGNLLPRHALLVNGIGRDEQHPDLGSKSFWPGTRRSAGNMHADDRTIAMWGRLAIGRNKVFPGYFSDLGSVAENLKTDC